MVVVAGTQEGGLGLKSTLGLELTLGCAMFDWLTKTGAAAGLFDV
jgi:hypothetical protein